MQELSANNFMFNLNPKMAKIVFGSVAFAAITIMGVGLVIMGHIVTGICLPVISIGSIIAWRLFSAHRRYSRESEAVQHIKSTPLLEISCPIQFWSVLISTVGSDEELLESFYRGSTEEKLKKLTAAKLIEWSQVK